jgi:hypothetical protein
MQLALVGERSSLLREDDEIDWRGDLQLAQPPAPDLPPIRFSPGTRDPRR